MDERGRVRPLVGLSKYSDFSDQYSNIDGLNASQLRGRLGIQGHIRNNTYIYADARYQRSFKGNKEGAQFNVGIKASFWFAIVVCDYVKTPLFETEGFSMYLSIIKFNIQC